MKHRRLRYRKIKHNITLTQNRRDTNNDWESLKHRLPEASKSSLQRSFLTNLVLNYSNYILSFY